MRWMTRLLFLASMALVATACGDDDDVIPGTGGVTTGDVQRYCEISCAKQDECGVLGMAGMTEESCVSFCTSNSNVGGDDSSSDCQPTSAEVNACFSAFEAASCDDIMNGDIPEECDLCPEESNTDVGMSDAGMGDVGTSGGSCDDLATCCGTLPEAAQGACMTTATSGSDIACGAAIDGYRQAGLC